MTAYTLLSPRRGKETQVERGRRCSIIPVASEMRAKFRRAQEDHLAL